MAEAPPLDAGNPIVNRRSRKDLTVDQIQFVIDQCVMNLQRDDHGESLINGKLVVFPGIMRALAIKIDCDIRTIHRTWKRAREAYEIGDTECFQSKSRKNKNGGMLKHDRDEIRDRIKNIPLKNRGTYRKLARALGLPKSTVHRIAKDKTRPNVINVHTNAIKPRLTEENKLSRILYAIDHLQLNHPDQQHFNAEIAGHDPGKFGLFDSCRDIVHLDEKWFFVTQSSQRLYLAEGELPPVRRVQHKSHISKVMFLSAVARPRFDENNVCTFDGKIGIWPFTKQVAAERASINRPRGAMVTTCVKVTAAVYEAMILDKVIPAIRAKWPDENRNVWLQHDNATSHFKADHEPFLVAGSALGWNIRLTPQPPNSPDLNINDLAFFRALQSNQWDSVEDAREDKDSLIEAVLAAYEDFPPKLLNFSFLTLAGCMEEILQSHGDNIYKIPHMRKEVLHRMGLLPKQVHATEASIEFGGSFLDYDF